MRLRGDTKRARRPGIDQAGVEIDLNAAVGVAISGRRLNRSQRRSGGCWGDIST